MSEKVMVFNLRRVVDKPRPKRKKTAMKLIRKLAQRHGKGTIVKISPKVNASIKHHNVPNRIQVKLYREEDIVYVLLPDEEVPKKKEEVKEEKDDNKS